MEPTKTGMISPLVSTVVISYNHEKYIRETLKSIESLTYSSIEVIIADNGSDDHSPEIIEEWVENCPWKVKFLKKTVKMNLCALLNESFKLCEGKYVQMISCDDLFKSDKLEKQVDALENLPNDYAVVYSDAFLIDGNGDGLEKSFISRARSFQKIPDGDIFIELVDGNFIPAMSVLIRKTLWEELGGFDEELKYEDYDFWLRASRRYKFKFLDLPSCSYRLHSTNWHKTDELKLNNYWIFKKHQGHSEMNRKLHDFGYKMYLDGKTNSTEYKDYKENFGLPRGRNAGINFAIRLRIPFFLLEKVHNLLGSNPS